MFKKIILTTIIFLCLGLISCTEVNGPIVKNTTYSVLNESGKPVDYWVENGLNTLKWVHVGNNRKIDRFFHSSFGELKVTEIRENTSIVKFDNNNYPHYDWQSAVKWFSITYTISEDTLKGQYWFGGPFIDVRPANFIALRGINKQNIVNK